MTENLQVQNTLSVGSLWLPLPLTEQLHQLIFPQRHDLWLRRVFLGRATCVIPHAHCGIQSPCGLSRKAWRIRRWPLGHIIFRNAAIKAQIQWDPFRPCAGICARRHANSGRNWPSRTRA